MPKGVCRSRITAEMMAECLEEISPEGRAEYEEVAEAVRINFKMWPRGRYHQMGVAMVAELIGSVLWYLSLPEPVLRAKARGDEIDYLDF